MHGHILFNPILTFWNCDSSTTLVDCALKGKGTLYKKLVSLVRKASYLENVNIDVARFCHIYFERIHVDDTVNCRPHCQFAAESIVKSLNIQT